MDGDKEGNGSMLDSTLIVFAEFVSGAAGPLEALA